MEKLCCWFEVPDVVLKAAYQGDMFIKKYLYLLEVTAPERKLYVAVSTVAYKSFFQQDVIQLILNRHQLPLIIVDIELEEIRQWIN